MDEPIKITVKSKYRHGQACRQNRSSLYMRWQSIKKYCHLQKTTIKICDEWNNSFEAFCDWAILNGYKEELKMERIDNNRGYEPSNCRWVVKRSGNRKNNDIFYKQLYDVWRSIKKRCFNPRNKDYLHYGGRGITICKEWRNNFKNFYNWAISNGYEKGLEIDRENNNGNYEPSNCRFVTRKANIRNRRNTSFATVNGITKSVGEWCEIYNLSRYDFKKRYSGNR